MRKTLFLIALSSFVVGSAWAKRPPVPVLPPVDDGGYRFVAFNEPPAHGENSYKSGHVAAYLKSTGEKVWEKWLYRVKWFPDQPRDLHEVYFKKMYLENPNLLILQNEREKWFVLERRTGDLLKDKPFKKRPDDPSVYYQDGNRVEPLLKDNYYIEAESQVSYGHQKVRAYDLPTGRLLWEKKIPALRDGSGGRSHISIMVLDGNGKLEITFDDGSDYVIDPLTGTTLKAPADH